MRRIIKLTAIVFISFTSIAQQATIGGVIYDNETGETLIGALIKIEGVSGGTISDLDGSYTISVDAGTYTLTCDYIGMPLRTEEITVVAGESKILDMRLEPEAVSAISGGTFTVTASKKQSTESALQRMQQKSIRVLDGVSAQTFKQKGDNDAGQAISRVTGISVQGGKHVFVRGLGDRYTKTILNGMIIPGLDPDRNSVQMDIFPTNVLDNIVVYKTFTPDLPGDFTGGTVDVATKAFPSKKTVTYSASFGYNPNMHFNPNYISYQGGKYDLLAYEDGTRDLPIGKDVDVTSVQLDPTANNPQLSEITKKFNKTLAPTKQMNGPDVRFGYSRGNQFNKANNRSYGYNLALNYSKQTDFFEEAYYATYIKPQESSSNQLELDRDAVGPQSSRTAQWSVLAGGAYKTGLNKYSLSVFRTQNGESRSAQLWQRDYRENPYVMFRNNLEYTQRSVTNILISGKHSIDSSAWELEWKLSPTFSKIDEPDIRLTAFELTDDENPVYVIAPSTGAVASRTYRYLTEQNYNAKIDLERKFKAKDGNDMDKLSFGVLETFKQRDYSIEDYRFNVQQANTEITFNGDANSFLSDENIWVPASEESQDSGVYVQGQKQPSNTYNAKQNIASAYLMHEYSLTKRLKTIYGVRFEHAQNYYTGEDQNGNKLRDSLLLNKSVLLPSLNFIYKLTTNQNLRLSATRTVARPSFKELSNAQIVDRISGRTFLGNINLVQTNINNLDLRWEMFQKQGQMISVSGFYKRFVNPIELVAFDAAAPDNFQPQNVGNANVYGLELEVKRKLNFVSKDTAYSTSVGINITLVESLVEMTEGEKQGRIDAARDGETFNDTRDMVGQSPYIVNAFLNYNHLASGTEFALSYNVQGPRLTVVGVSRNPDVYEMPFHSLNLKATKKFGKRDHWKASLSAQNILGAERYFEYVSYGAENQVFSLLKPHRNYSIGIGYIL